MASIIAKQPKDIRKQTTVSLSGTVLADLELYCRFIDSARDWVINEALKGVFRKDKAFLEWKERSGAANGTKPGEVLPAGPSPTVPVPLSKVATDHSRPGRPRSEEPPSAA